MKALGWIHAAHGSLFRLKEKACARGALTLHAHHSARGQVYKRGPGKRLVEKERNVARGSVGAVHPLYVVRSNALSFVRDPHVVLGPMSCDVQSDAARVIFALNHESAAPSAILFAGPIPCCHMPNHYAAPHPCAAFFSFVKSLKGGAETASRSDEVAVLFMFDTRGASCLFSHISVQATIRRIVVHCQEMV